MVKRTKKLVALALIMSIISGCGAQNETSKDIVLTNPGQDEETSDASASEQGINEPQDMTTVSSELYLGERPVFMKNVEKSEVGSIKPCVEPYTVEPDLSNVDNLWQFYFDDKFKNKLSQNGFVVAGTSGSEFFDIYEINRYSMIPSFVTVDSLMHTYHLYFGHLLKNVEKNYLSDSLTRLSRKMLDNSVTQYEQLKGSEWDSAAKRNVAFFTGY